MTSGVSAFYSELFHSAKNQEARLKKVEEWKTAMRRAAREGKYNVAISCDDKFATELLKEGFFCVSFKDHSGYDISWEKEKV